MRRVVSLGLAVAMLVDVSLGAEAPAGDLQVGIKQVGDGDFTAAIVTLQAAAQKLAPEGAERSKELTQAHLYMGVAFVGLAQEERAKESFREALKLDAALRIAKGQFPDRVVRVFEAARTGKEKSVLERPSDAPKKAGLGAAGLALIIGGAVALAGGAAAVATRSGPSTTTPRVTVTGRWEGTYAWNCSPGRNGSSALIFVLNETDGRITGSATYLAGVGSVTGTFNTSTMDVRLTTPGSSTFVNNEFTGRLSEGTITGTTLNGDTSGAGSRGCSAATPPSGTFNVRRVSLSAS